MSDNIGIDDVDLPNSAPSRIITTGGMSTRGSSRQSSALKFVKDDEDDDEENSLSDALRNEKNVFHVDLSVYLGELEDMEGDVERGDLENTVLSASDVSKKHATRKKRLMKSFISVLSDISKFLCVILNDVIFSLCRLILYSLLLLYVNRI